MNCSNVSEFLNRVDARILLNKTFKAIYLDVILQGCWNLPTNGGGAMSKVGGQ